MKKADLYNNVKGIEFIGTCTDESVAKIARKLHYVGNKRKIHKILKQFGFDDVGGFLLSELETFYNPYRYWIGLNYIDVVHSDIDHVFRIIRD